MKISRLLQSKQTVFPAAFPAAVFSMAESRVPLGRDSAAWVVALPADDTQRPTHMTCTVLADSSHGDSHVGSVSPAPTRTRTLALGGEPAQHVGSIAWRYL